MDWSNVTWLLTGLGAVVVLLTRVRLGGGAERRRSSGVAGVASGLVKLHTLFGVLALVLWSTALVTLRDVIVYAALAAWWIVVVLGLLLLARWLPSAGRHSEETAADAWGAGAGLSALGHLGMLVGVTYFTFVALTNRL
ncbi:hypothetical protein [Kribbella deserti]|uniref:Uncharacterized protein n=1 Tax=Kribbella deserti TaxID=1926257 RepID=A0ABV6QR98_9ACTN